MKFDHFFATQYKQCFIYCGIPDTHDTSIDKRSTILSGCVAAIVETDKEDGYIWSHMPQLSIQFPEEYDSVQLLGGLVSGDEIKLIGMICPTITRAHQAKSSKMHKSYQKQLEPVTKCWTTSLTTPSNFARWFESEYTPQVKYTSQANSDLVAVQQCKDFVIYFYKSFNDSYFGTPEPVGSVVITKQQEELSCRFSAKLVSFNRHVNCAIVGADMFIINGNKMAKIENFETSLYDKDVYYKRIRMLSTSSMSFNLKVPHTDSSLFVAQNTLFTVGGRDQNYDEPFYEIYQFNQSTQKWKECGFSTVSRFGASVVVLTDKNSKESVFIVGGFKGKDMPCGVIEELSVNIKSTLLTMFVE